MTRAEVESEIRAVVGRSFGVDAATLSDATTSDDVDGWDSLAHATLLLRIERTFDVDLDRRAAVQAVDLGALTELVRRAIEDRDA